LKRGDIYLATDKGEYSGKPRPVLIVQREITLALRDSVSVLPLTGADIGINIFRHKITPNHENGLEKTSFAMVDKVNSVNKSRLKSKIGSVSEQELDTVDNMLRFWLNL
jgi:mRNA interferase MazF